MTKTTWMIMTGLQSLNRKVIHIVHQNIPSCLQAISNQQSTPSSSNCEENWNAFPYCFLIGEKNIFFQTFVLYLLFSQSWFNIKLIFIKMLLVSLKINHSESSFSPQSPSSVFTTTFMVVNQSDTNVNILRSRYKSKWGQNSCSSSCDQKVKGANEEENDDIRDGPGWNV